MSITRWLMLMLLIGVAVMAQAADFTLREELNRQWTREYVTFPLTAVQAKQAQAGLPLLDSEGKSLPYQVLPGGARIAFQGDLTPLATRTFSFADKGKADRTTDLKVEETADAVRISNGLTGIWLAKAPAVGNGPIAGIKLNSGKWAGGSRLATDASVTGYSVQVTARGPVMAEAVCKVTFGDKGTWETRYRVIAGEPVVLVDETSAVDTPATCKLMLSDNFNAESIFFRSGDAPYGKNIAQKIGNGLVFDWEPWLRWHASIARGSTFSVYNAQENDLLSVAAREAGAWVDPKLPGEKQAFSPLKVIKDDTGVHADLPLKHGQRKWMLGAFNRDATLAIMQDEKQAVASPIPYRYLIKYGHFPLDMIKDYVTRWPTKLEHPRLLMTKKDVERFRAQVKDPAPYQQKVQSFLDYIPGNRGTDLNEYTMDDAIPAFLATQDLKLSELMAKKVITMMEYMITYLIDQNDGLPFGAAPHHQQSLATAVGLADIIYNSPQTTPEQRDRIRALAAFLGYTTSRPEYWSTARGYAANPNMTTSVYGYQASLAAFISDHPCAKEWATEGLTALKEQLDTWSDENGGWLEAPHYAMVSYDQILALLVMANNAGFNDWLYTDPKVKAVIRWFAQIDTPPDSRIGGFRHRPPLGNTYMNEPNGEYGLLAYLFRDKDPQFSAEMQWQYKQNNMYGTPGIGGFFPAFAGYRRLLTDPTLPEQAPKYASVLFPNTGLVLRDSYPSPRETYLHMIHGDHHAHYDDDSGSIVLYGKGRILADEYGYYGYTPQEDHNMLESPAAGRGLMHLREFTTSPRFDYTAGVKEAWTRQIAMVKGATPDAPTYFVINDSLNVASPATWRLWLTAQEVKLNGQYALVVGNEDVDMDVLFITPDGVTLTTEPKTRTSGSGMFPNWSWGPMPTTQQGLIAKMAHVNGYTTLLYPRLKTAKSPVVTALAGGKVIKVAHEAGTDYIFLSNAPFNFDEGDIHFSGMAGMVQLRGAEVVVAMGSGGKISARGKTAVSDKPLPKAVKNLFPNNGDFENGKLAPLTAVDNGLLQLSLYKGNPAAGDTTHTGKYCAAFTLKEKGDGVMGAGYSIPVDPLKVYRISMNVYSTVEIMGQFGGYGVNDVTQNVRTKTGDVWEWSFWAKGPTNGWKIVEVTIGPEGSGAQIIWPPNISSTHITCRIGGEAGTFYVDDIAVEPQ
ncbi:MAG: hypothetical protein ACYDBB_00690 [Armatimonadota bacterium]